MGSTWGPSGSCRSQMGPMMAPWALLSGMITSSALQYTPYRSYRYTWWLIFNHIVFSVSIQYVTICILLLLCLYMVWCKKHPTLCPHWWVNWHLLWILWKKLFGDITSILYLAANYVLSFGTECAYIFMILTFLPWWCAYHVEFVEKIIFICQQFPWIVMKVVSSNTLKNACDIADNIGKCIFLHGHVHILIQISLKCVPKGSIDIMLALVQIMAWCQTLWLSHAMWHQ